MAEVADDAGVNRSWGDLAATPRVSGEPDFVDKDT
jgi:hypothetical protein